MNDIDSAIKIWDSYLNAMEKNNQNNANNQLYVTSLKGNAKFKLNYRRWKEAAASYEQSKFLKEHLKFSNFENSRFVNKQFCN